MHLPRPHLTSLASNPTLEEYQQRHGTTASQPLSHLAQPLHCSGREHQRLPRFSHPERPPAHVAKALCRQVAKMQLWAPDSHHQGARSVLSQPEHGSSFHYRADDPSVLWCLRRQRVFRFRQCLVPLRAMIPRQSVPALCVRAYQDESTRPMRELLHRIRRHPAFSVLC